MSLWINIRRNLPALSLILAVASLTGLGLIILFSVTHSQYTDPYFIVQRQVIWLCLAVVAAAAAFFIDLEKMRAFVWLIALSVIIMLALVLIPGIGLEINGARRWLDLGPMNMQVSDFAKIGLIFVLSHYLAQNQRSLKSFEQGFFIPSLIIGSVVVLILLQPDFGTAFLTGVIGFTLLFLAGVRLIYLIPSVFISGVLFCIAIFLDPVRLKRITAFLDVEGNRSDGAYQLWQGILAFGAGGMSGVGLGNGRQQMAFLPEAHTDFIFPIIGEELGFFFTTGVVFVFLGIFLIGVWQLRRSPNLFQFLFASGALMLITLQALLNFGIVTGCLPTKGMSLPFISYGGSNLVCMFFLVGIILNYLQEWNRSALRKPREL